MTTPMNLPDWVQGNRATAIAITFVRQDGTAYAFPIGAVVTGRRFHPASKTAVDLSGSMVPTIGGNLLTYAPSVDDVAVTGSYTVQFTVTAAGLPETTFEAGWIIAVKR